MGKLKVTVHPLFIVFGLYFAVIGKVFSFLTFTLVALIHECGHFAASSRLGYELYRITLMPYGAVIRGKNDCFSFADEVLVALAGPAINIFTVILFVAIWWFFPETYPYLELAVTASAAIAVINLIPAYPLDGGRILLATLSTFLPRKCALMIAKGAGIASSAVMLALFVYSCFTVFNLSLLFFSLFMLMGNIFVPKENEYVRIYSVLSFKNLSKGKKITRIAVDERTRIKDIFPHLSGGALVDIEITGEKKTVLSCDKTARLLIEGDIYSTVSDEAERLFLLRKR